MLNGISYSFAFRLIENIFSVFLFSLSVGLLECNLIKSIEHFLQFFKRPPKKDKQLVQLDERIREIKETMSELSPTNDFAKYFKCERLLRKLQEEHEVIEKRAPTSSVNISLKWSLFFRGAFILTSLLLALHSTEIYFTMDSRYFYPLTSLSLIRFNGIFGDEEPQNGLCVITLFDFLILSILVRKIYTYRQRSINSFTS